jgi:class 3 adenylate cyclase
MPGAAKKSLDRPDDRVAAEGIAADVVQVGEASVSRNTFQPGAHCGIAVHEASRIAAAAGAGEILVSTTTRALAGSDGLTFGEGGVHQLKGLDGPRELYSVEVS